MVDRSGERTYVLPPVDSIRRSVAFLLGLIERRDGSEVGAATRLGEELFAEIVRDLDPAIRRLVVLPDDVLWQVPLDLLRPGLAGQAPLAERFELSLAPSATLWEWWVNDETVPFSIPVLALADPELPVAGDDGTPAAMRSWALERGMTLGPLPHARDEARSLTRRLGGGSRMWLASEASEAALKQIELTEFGLLHVAAHAVVDDEHPDRSAIVLTPGDAEQDGLLQPREIVTLDLRGRVVVLTACRSASGSVMEGEGPLSLSRAFFQAGAHAVVGSLWPLRDDDTARLMDAFSSRLADGASVAQALATARRQMASDGAPAAAWAGLVLIGDGSVVPVPGGTHSRSQWAVVLLAGAVVLGCLVVLALARTRESRPAMRRIPDTERP